MPASRQNCLRLSGEEVPGREVPGQMTRSLLRAAVSVTVVLIANAGPALAKGKTTRADAPKLSCARASYPGDPVCDADEHGILPTPSSRAVQNGQRPSGYRVDDSISVSGKNDFNADRYHGTIINNPNPSPHSQDINGGGAVNYKF